MRVFGLTRLTPRERYVIGLLRGVDPDLLAGTLHTLLNRLRAAVQSAGYRTGPFGSEYATLHEMVLLGALAGLQREQADLSIQLSNNLHLVVRDCARALANSGVVLPHGTFMRLVGLGDACRELSIAVVPARRRRKRREAVSLCPTGMSGARAFQFVRARGDTSIQEFAEYGVSRQMVSLLRRQGLLQRVRTGVYRAAPETAGG